MAKRVAVIDIGSNSVRMVIYEKTSRYAFHLLHEAKSKVRISEHAYTHGGKLQEVPMRRTFLALKEFLTIADSYKVKKTLCVATSALRDAPNKKDFLKKVKDALKLNIKVIDGEKEAYYGGVACLNLLPKLHSALSIDIGGGSTEFTIIDEKNITNTLSLDIGTVRLKELFCDSHKLTEATQYIDSKLEFLDNITISTLVGIGGTFRAISKAIMENSNYPLNKIHAYEYSDTIFKTFIVNILEANEKELKILGIERNRFDVIKPGALILQRVLQKLSSVNIITSGVGVREGVYLCDLLRNSNDKFPHNYNTSVKHIIDSHIDNKSFSNQLNTLSKKIFNLTYKYLNIDKQFRYELALAAKLYPSGNSVHFYSQNKHAYYLIQSALEYGFTHQSITLIATLIKYTKNKLPVQSHLQKYEMLLPQKSTTYALSYILSLSIALLSHRPRNLDFKLDFIDNILYIKSDNDLYLSQNAVKKIECEQNFSIQF